MIDQKTKKHSKLTPICSNLNRYTMMGDPTFMESARFGNGKIGDISKRNKTRDSITISSQHDERPLYRAPVLMLLNFYFEASKRMGKKKIFNKPGNRQCSKPNLISCINYIQDVCKGILFQDKNVISSVEAYKYYDNEPRVEFWIIEL